MKYRSNQFTAFILVGFAIMASSTLALFSGVALAEDSPKKIQFNLNQPPVVEEEPDAFTEKYEKVMSEISISDEAAEVVNQIKDVVEDIEDLCVDIAITEMRERRNEEVLLHLKVSVEHKLARLEFQGPSAVRGVIVVADQANMEVHTFQPVTNVILIRGLEDASKEALTALSMGQDLTQLTSYLDFSQYQVEILEKAEQEGITDYLLKVDAPEDETWYVRVKDDSWFPHEISVYKEGILQGTMNLSGVVLNPGLSVEEISSLPNAKVERI
jgi:outer membrane lipoprotein-sorting protein